MSFASLGAQHPKARELLYHQSAHSAQARPRDWARDRYNNNLGAFEKELLDIESREIRAQKFVQEQFETYISTMSEYYHENGRLHPHDASLQERFRLAGANERQLYSSYSSRNPQEYLARHTAAFKDVIKVITKGHKQMVGHCVACGQSPDELKALDHHPPIRLESAHVCNRSEMEKSIQKSVLELNLGWVDSVYETRVRLLNRHLCLNPEANGLYQGPACVCLCTICHGLKDGRTHKYLFESGVYDRFIGASPKPKNQTRAIRQP